ncbi:hypothetical protein E3N88_21736 [Mikania micrantha]|uniref:Uncharacterized protein n=1 Tax=Mikania micrantha TaxID=192012 RepID=A0A5N6NB15_9ASTR|nr:hypothetical protein E3N88_21736 [Mikania micrantha]
MADFDDQSVESGAMIGSNEDLLIEILHRLPIVSILRFKSVSKHWRSLLSQHNLIRLMYGTGLFVGNLFIPYDAVENRSSRFRTLDFYPDQRRFKIVQSCNGLLLCCSDVGHSHVRDYFVVNPTTKQCVMIPPVIRGMDVVTSVRFMGLAFHQTSCVNYKVICIYRDTQYDERLQVQIYSSDTGKWKSTLDEYIWVSYYTPFSGGVYWNGSFLWAPSSVGPKYLKLDIERFFELSLPSPLPARVAIFGGYREGARPLYFGESRGHLHLVDTSDHENHLHLNVYEMSNDRSGWFVKHRVELDDLRAAYPDMTRINQQQTRPDYYNFEILDVVRGENDDEDSFMVIKVSKKIIRYNIFDKSFKQIFDLTNTLHENIGPWDVHRYTGTITSFY